MVLVRDRRAKQCKDAIARRLHDVAVVALYRIDHQLQRRVDNRACLFGVEVCHQLGRTLDVGEQCCDRLALTLKILGRGTIGYSSLVNMNSILLLRVPRSTPIAVPRFLQNRAPTPTGAWHDGQYSFELGAALLAEPASTGLSVLQGRAQHYALSSSSSALASFRSCVSNPSVNQL